MKLRFTYSHEDYGSIVASEPGGFDNAQLGFERGEQGWSLSEFYKAPFAAYGTNGIDNGAREWVKAVETIYGPDAEINVLTEIAPDNYTWEELYRGTIAVAMFIERVGEDHLLDMAFNQQSFWTKFIARFETPVNIQSPVSLDGEDISIITATDLPLPSQVVRYLGSYEMEYGFFYGETVDYVMILDWEKAIIDDINKFTLGKGSIASVAPYDTQIGLFEAPWDGSYRVRFRTVSASPALGIGVPPGWVDTYTPFEIRVRNINLTTYLTGTNTVETVGADSYIITDFDEIINLSKGEQIAIYGVGEAISVRFFFGNRILIWKTFVDVATTGQITLSGEQTIDGILTSASDILVKDQAIRSENGIYTTGAGAWTRRSDCDTAAELINAAVDVSGGTIYGSTQWIQVEDVVTLGTDDIFWETTVASDLEKVPYTGSPVDTFLEITADTTYDRTTSQSFLIHDVGAMIADRIINQNGTFYSEYLGRTNTLARIYDENGCGSPYMLSKGLQIRQYLLSEKPFFLSFKDWWEGINPILCLGFGYDIIDGNKVIRVEDRAHFFDDSSTSVNLSNIQTITRRYDLENQFNSAKLGYIKWQSEDISGIDDPQTVRTWASRFKNIGKTIQLLSSYIAASLAIETTRRTTKTKSADYKFDNDTFIISVVEDGDSFKPELDEGFTDVTGLLNEETRYNKSLTVARNFIRNLPFLNGALQSYVGSLWRFVSGEGNFDMESTMSGCNGGYDEVVSEKQDFTVDETFLFKPIVYEIKHYLTFTQYKLIKANRNLAIGISLSTTGHKKVFIKSLSVNPINADLDLIVWAKEELDLSVQTSPPTVRRIFDFSFDDTLE